MIYVLNTEGATGVAAGIVLRGDLDNFNSALAVLQYVEARSREVGSTPPSMRIVAAVDKFPKGTILKTSEIVREYDLDGNLK